MRVNTIICDDLYTYEMLKDMNSEFIDALYLNEDEEECEEPEEEYDDTQVIGGEQLSMLNDMGLFVVAGRYDEAGTAEQAGKIDNELAPDTLQPDTILSEETSTDAKSEPALYDDYGDGEGIEVGAYEPKSKQKKRKITGIAPQILPMQEYIVRNYENRIRKGLCENLLAGNIPVDSWSSGKRVVEVYVDTFRIGKMTFWRKTSRTCIAYVQVSVDFIESVNGKERIASQSFAAVISFDMMEEKIETEITYNPYCSNIAEYWGDSMLKLDDYLVPIMDRDAVEKYAWDIHCRIFWDYNQVALAAMSDDERRREYDAYEMAQRMGLEVKVLPLHGQSKTKSVLFFVADKVKIDVEGTDGRKTTCWEIIPADCIVLNSNSLHKDMYQLEVFHECVHYDLHYMFYRLQEMHINDLRKLKKTTATPQVEKRTKSSIYFIEKQAFWGSFALMMPLPVMIPLVNGLIEKYKPYSRHAGDLFARIIHTIHERRGHAKFRIRARLIQMGHIAAKGALNYVDGHYIEPFAFQRSNGDGCYTFVIDRKEIAREYRENKEFREQIRTGEYVYADGHICINSPDYVYQTSQGLRLTRWALAHVDECCLRFRSFYDETELAEYVFGRLACDEDYNKHYLNYVDSEGKLSRAKAYKQIPIFLKNLPSGFFPALDFLKTEKKYSWETVEELSHVSKRKLERERKKKKWSLTRDEVIALCIGLSMPPWLSKEMLKRAHVALDDQDDTDCIYSLILELHFMDTIDEVQSFLRNEGCEELDLLDVAA